MSTLTNERNKKYDWLFICIAIVVAVRILIYLYILIGGWGTLQAFQYFKVFINFVMYTSILKYTIDYFKKGKEVSMMGMLLRYSASMVAAINTARYGNTVVFILIAMTILIVPYIAGGVDTRKNGKRTAILMVVVLVIALCVSGIQLAFPPADYVFGLGKMVYCLDACNSSIQWILFCILYALRIKLLKEEEK